MVSLSQLQKALICLVLTFSSICTAQELRTFRENNLYGYKRGNSIAIPAKFNYAADFHNNRAAVLLNKKWGYIDEKGTLVIPAEMDRAENFQYGFARFYQNGKIGLMDTMGKKIVHAICDKIDSWDGDRWGLTSGTEKGMFIKSEELYIAPEYKSLDLNKHFIICQKQNSTFDVLLRSTSKKFTDVTERPIMTQYYNTVYCDLALSGNIVMIDTLGNPVIDKSKYKGIAYFNVNVDHVIGENSKYYDRVYLLQLNDDSTDVFNEFGEEIPSEFHLFFDESYQFNDAVYTDFVTSYSRFEVKKNGQPGYLNETGKLMVSKYMNVENLGDYLLLFNRDNSVDIGRYIYYYEADKIMIDTTIKYHFTNAEKVFITSSTINEEGDQLEFKDEAFQLIQVKNEAGEYALFHLDKGEYLTPFAKNPLELLTYDNYDNTFIVFSSVDNGKFYSLNGKISRMAFYDYVDMGDFYLINYPDGTREVISVNDNYVVTISSDYDCIHSNKMYNYEAYSAAINENPENDINESIFHFNFDFIVLIENVGGQDKYGFITKSGHVVEPQFDEIEPLRDLDPRNRKWIIQTRNGDKYGFCNFRSDDRVDPQFNSPLHEHDYYGSQNVLITEDSTHFISIHGNEVPALESEYDIRDGKNHGLASANFNLENPIADTLIFPFYKEVESMSYGLYRTSSKYHFGLYSSMGDELLIPEFDSIEEMEELPTNHSYIVYASEGKKGIFDSENWVQSPTMYDEISFHETSYGIGDYLVSDIIILARDGSKTDILNADLSVNRSGFDFVFPLEGEVKAFLTQYNGHLGRVEVMDDFYMDYRHPGTELDLYFNGDAYVVDGDSIRTFDISNMQLFQTNRSQTILASLKNGNELIYNGKTVSLTESKSQKVLWSTTSKYLTLRDNRLTYFEDGEFKICPYKMKTVKFPNKAIHDAESNFSNQ